LRYRLRVFIDCHCAPNPVSRLWPLLLAPRKTPPSSRCIVPSLTTEVASFGRFRCVRTVPQRWCFDSRPESSAGRAT
jgi:hypothetical protein